MKTLAIFDLDGTLIDSGRVVSGILNQMRFEMNKDLLGFDFYVPWLSLGGEELVSNSLGIRSTEVSPYLDEFRKRYSNTLTPIDSVYVGVFDLLGYLRKKGIKISICTNKPRKLAEKVLFDTRLDGFIEYMCAGDDLKSKKPNPANLEVCVKYFNESYQNAILIGDSRVDQNLAASLGVDFAYFKRGYNDGVDEDAVNFSFENHSEIMELFI